MTSASFERVCLKWYTIRLVDILEFLIDHNHRVQYACVSNDNLSFEYSIRDIKKIIPVKIYTFIVFLFFFFFFSSDRIST
jgi:hypothetical protein